MTGAFRPFYFIVAIACWIGLGVVSPHAQQRRAENLQVFPEDMPRGELIQKMREFSFALDVRCEYCHMSGDDLPSEDRSFSSDAKVTKETARYMLRMMESINAGLTSDVPGHSDESATVECATCHRGSAQPKLLATVLTEVIAADSPGAAVSRYRDLREDARLGKYSFSEWTINELARELEEDGKPEAAIAMLEMNAGYYPESAAIDLALANLHATEGERDKAIERYRMALEKNPDNTRARERLEALEAEPN